MKVVYNDCYGGFSLSDEATERYLTLKGWTFFKEVTDFGSTLYSTPDDPQWWNREIERDDPTLVQVVEEMGEKANGACADLQIHDVPSGSLWRIDEYDGNERVMLQSEYKWKVAT